MSNLRLNLTIVRSFSTCQRVFRPENNEIAPIFINRNPRNLERLRIAYKPDGYHLEKPGKCYWHKLKLTVSQRHATASVVHYLNGEVITASTKEWAIKKQLYKTSDTAAYMNLGRILAQRCLEAGLTEVRCDIKPTQEGKVSEFLKALQQSGICLEEPPQYKHPQPWDMHRPEKPWQITE